MMMASVAISAVVMGVLRVLCDFFGFDLIFFLAVNLLLYVYIPIVVVVELLFFAFYFPLRRKRREADFNNRPNHDDHPRCKRGGGGSVG
jgi:hypothetical protein